ncbi:rod shape-determining protein [Lyticum sinuosum]|uniref:Cell shape-determining protein MreB n=1 Tax=Lyticum sinuosum TaxID=1332059 RepID=A0AAE4VJQ1_9RICK|nr:rod shape-determining protein [Lyticum sinuosum]MDZ5761091.1 Rod shape-determining protein MreB [Lyticum sinuosum]
MANYFTQNIAIDLGTANTLIYTSKRGVVLDQPSVVALVHNKGNMIPYAFGKQAKMMVGKTPGDISAIRPLKDGVIADFKAAEEMIKYFIKSVIGSSFFLRPIAIVCVPYGSTPVERRAIHDAVESAGAKEVFLIEEPIAAAIGANLPITEPVGSMIVDIGGGTTEVGVISLGSIVVATSTRVGGDLMDECIINYIRQNYNILIGEVTAEMIKKSISNIDPELVNDETIEVGGRDLLRGIPKSFNLNQRDIATSLQDPIASIINTVKKVLECSPPELSSDVFKYGITVTGGGALLCGIDRKLETEIGIKVNVAVDPLNSVVLGTGKVLENFDGLKHVLFKQE